MTPFEKREIFSVGFRIADVRYNRSERQLSALSVEMCVVQHSGHFPFPALS